MKITKNKVTLTFTKDQWDNYQFMLHNINTILKKIELIEDDREIECIKQGKVYNATVKSLCIGGRAELNYIKTQLSFQERQQLLTAGFKEFIT